MLTNLDHLDGRFGPALKELKAQIDQRYEGNPYVLGHASRFAASVLLLDEIILPGYKVLEIGFSGVLHHYIQTEVACWDYTTFTDGGATATVRQSTLHLGGEAGPVVPSRVFGINLEQNTFPLDTAEYDLVICCEVIEHMEVDPMRVMAELNRITLTGGQLFLTTPNSVSARIVYKVINGYHPSFFLKYTRDAALYRHNFEYTPPLAAGLAEAAGYRVAAMETHDVFEQPLQQGYELLQKLGAPAQNRGDNIFLTAVKETEVRDRFPSSLYA